MNADLKPPKNRLVTLAQMTRNLNSDFELEPWIDDVLHTFALADTGIDLGSFDWVLRKLKEHNLGWVKFGAWAFFAKVRRIYDKRFRSWREFCEKVLHKTH